MCGIVCAVAQRDVASVLIEGLKRLEYRGYDSAGLAVLDETLGAISRRRAQGKVVGLETLVADQPAVGTLGIAHTRWATHGIPSEHNAHPHVSDTQDQTVAVVHNGIIENFAELKQELQSLGYQFASDTDTEVIVHLIHHYLANTSELLQAVKLCLKKLKGAYALGVIATKAPGKLIAARVGSPLVIGCGIGENFIASDQLALQAVTDRFIYLDEGDVAEITRDEISIWDQHDQPQVRQRVAYDGIQEQADKGEYRHFMLKEIYEQPMAVRQSLDRYLQGQEIVESALGDRAESILDQVKSIQIVACGTSYHAGLVARYWFEQVAGIHCQVEIASEFRYRQPVALPNTLLVSLSQSGETADTLAAVKMAKSFGYLATLTICNVPGSSLVRESDLALMTCAGPEIGVASTKAFTTQLVAMSLLVLMLARRFGVSDAERASWLAALRRLPTDLQSVLALDHDLERLAETFGDKHHALFLGRGSQYPIAMEGALKLKEISYIHAEAYAAGELKHGPLALVDDEMPVIAVAPNNELVEKLLGNLQEVRARGGLLYVFADQEVAIEAEDGVVCLKMPKVDDLIAPIIYTLPLQLLSYHVALIKGTDVDQPRNLAKSVTVE